MRYPTLWRTPSLFSDDLFSVGRGLDRLFDRGFFGDDFEGRANRQTLYNWVPAVDVRETGEAINLDFELPGMKPEDINVTVQNGMLTVSGERSREFKEGEESSGFSVRERRYGRFERSFSLPNSVDAEKLEAHYENGILTVYLPKHEEAKPRRIEVSGAQEHRRIEAGQTA